MLADRLVRARRAAALSDHDAAQQAKLSYSIINQYESGKLVPSPAQLARLAKTYGVGVDYFLRQNQIAAEAFQFRKRAKLTGERLEVLKYRILDQIERRLELESYFPTQQVAVFAGITELPNNITKLDQMEAIAEQVRDTWELGFGPIPNLADLLEIHGFRVLSIDLTEEEQQLFDGATLEDQPIVVMGSNWPGDRQRFTLAHEFGHAIMRGRLSPELNEEKSCNRFAGAFLLPANNLRKALGNQRQRIEIQELMLLKQEYRLSMQAIIFRSRDSGIIADNKARQLHAMFHKNGWDKNEPGENLPSERLSRFEALLYHALAEDLISESKAAELFGMSLLNFRQQRRMDLMNGVAN